MARSQNAIVIATWKHGYTATNKAYNLLNNNGLALDAVEKGVRVAESDSAIRTVGYGGYTDQDGNVTLDASIMDHLGNAGSVAYLKEIKHPISVARKIMEKSNHVMLVGDGAQKFALQNGFNKDMFNATFEQYKKEKSNQNQNQNKLIKYKEPEVRISMSNQDSLMTLGQGKVSDFGGSTDNLFYTDYKQAFTDGSTLIDTSTVDLKGRSNSINGVKAQRSNISYQMSPEDQQRVAIQQMKEQEQEKQRLQRLNVYDQQHEQTYEKIHSMLLR